LSVFSARHTANPVEGFLSLRLRSLWFVALLGLLAPLCAGQDPVPLPQKPPPQSPAPQGQAPGADQSSPQGQPPSQDQSSQGQSSQGQSTQGQSSSKDQPSADEEALPKPPPPTQIPQNKSPQKPPLLNQVPQSQSLITLDSNETIFAMLAALNTCGYDQDLTISDVTRSKVRAEVQKNLLGSEEAEAARTALCEFYQGHMASNDANRNLSQ
jgi:hypothetical protein